MPILEVTQEAFNFKDSGGEPAQVFLSSPVFKSLHWAGCPFSSSPSPVQELGGLKVFKITSSTEYDGKCQRDILPPFQQPLVAVGCDWSAYWSAHSNQTQGALVVVALDSDGSWSRCKRDLGFVWSANQNDEEQYRKTQMTTCWWNPAIATLYWSIPLCTTRFHCSMLR